MFYIESVMLLLLLLLGIISSISDIKNGIIANKLLLIFFLCGIITSAVYYAFFARYLFLLFFFNLLFVAVISLVLFFTHSFAGGDSKLAIVFSVLFPARFYLSYGGSRMTLLFALCLALFYGYLYLLLAAVGNLLQKKTKITKSYIKSYIVTFGKTYVTVFPYIMLLTLLFEVISRYFISVNTIIEVILCFVFAWSFSKIGFLQKHYILIPVIVADIVLSIFLKKIPISLHPENYIFTLIIILFQMTIRTNIYEEIKTSDVKKGMILSTASSLLMQNSRVRNLPSVSSENLRSRLTETEAESVHRWANSATGADTVVILKKIPFAVFLTLGFLCYMVLWLLLV